MLRIDGLWHSPLVMVNDVVFSGSFLLESSAGARAWNFRIHGLPDLHLRKWLKICCPKGSCYVDLKGGPHRADGLTCKPNVTSVPLGATKPSRRRKMKPFLFFYLFALCSTDGEALPRPTDRILIFIFSPPSSVSLVTLLDALWMKETKEKKKNGI